MRVWSLLFFTLAHCSDPDPAVDAGRSDGGASDGGSSDAAFDAGLDASTPDGGGSDLNAVFCEPLAAFVCGSASDCGCGALVPGGALDRDACVARWTVRCAALWQPFLDAGAVLDPAAASACIDAVRAGTPACARPSGTVVFAECRPFLIDPAAIGAPCTSPYCAGGDGVCVEGMCAMRGAAGASCGDMFGCATGLACDGERCFELRDSGAACTVDLECAPPLRCVSGASGTVCGALGEIDAPCIAASDCAIGLVCEDGACSAGPAACDDGATCGHAAMCGGARTCVPRSPAGAECAGDRDCEASLFCDGGTCTARPGDGDSCARGTVCAAGLGCDTDGGTCRPLPTGGMPCAFGERGPLCADGFACADGTVCGPLPVAGEPCAGTECAPGLGCDFTPEGSICIVPREEGGSCESDRSCAAAFHCGPSGTCEADLPAGSPCTVGNECAGICGPDASGGLSCRDAPDEGDPCVFADDCPASATCAAEERRCFPEICAEL
jgi:hypothetical protein